ncbi:hypothetical protein FA13DRAFT_677006 [Coprinellus micaceus]|uniref:Uncharacterized protein n=1 Tax=Coprinellus micaceus TaxID=71717 RepID=A0A4Y7S9K3_COPMI|nr:hypothetical protein FA13DRAFT_677006 [Coprinellus micaceus]
MSVKRPSHPSARPPTRPPISRVSTHPPVPPSYGGSLCWCYGHEHDEGVAIVSLIRPSCVSRLCGPPCEASRLCNGSGQRDTQLGPSLLSPPLC